MVTTRASASRSSRSFGRASAAFRSSRSSGRASALRSSRSSGRASAASRSNQVDDGNHAQGAAVAQNAQLVNTLDRLEEARQAMLTSIGWRNCWGIWNIKTEELLLAMGRSIASLREELLKSEYSEKFETGVAAYGLLLLLAFATTCLLSVSAGT